MYKKKEYEIQAQRWYEKYWLYKLSSSWQAQSTLCTLSTVKNLLYAARSKPIQAEICYLSCSLPGTFYIHYKKKSIIVANKEEKMSLISFFLFYCLFQKQERKILRQAWFMKTLDNGWSLNKQIKKCIT